MEHIILYGDQYIRDRQNKLLEWPTDFILNFGYYPESIKIEVRILDKENLAVNYYRYTDPGKPEGWKIVSWDDLDEEVKGFQNDYSNWIRIGMPTLFNISLPSSPSLKNRGSASNEE